MTPNLPAVIAELKRLKHACQVRDKWLREDSREEYTDALIEHADTLLAAAEECEQLRVQLAGCGVAALDGSAEQEAKTGAYGWSPAYADVLHLRRKYDVMARDIEEWDRRLKAKAEECERLREALDEVTTCPTCNGEKVWTPECQGCLSGYGSCTCTTEKPMPCPQCDGSGRDFAGSDKARAALEGKT